MSDVYISDYCEFVYWLPKLKEELGFTVQARQIKTKLECFYKSAHTVIHILVDRASLSWMY